AQIDDTLLDQVREEGETGTRVAGREQPLRVERADRRDRRRLVRGADRISVENRRFPDARIGAARELRHARERVDDTLARGGIERRGRRIVERDHFGSRIRVVGEPAPNAHTPHADGRQDVAPVGQLGRLHHTRDRGDVETRVATADFTPSLDEDYGELVVTLEDVAHHQAIPRLEYVQR